MDIPELKRSADRALGNADYSPRRLVLIHTGAALAVSLVLSLISYYVGSLSTAGGLSGMGTQSALTTAQVVLQAVWQVASPFWQAGLVFAALCYARNRQVAPGSLLQGFRRFKPMLSSYLLRGVQYLGIGFVSIYLSSMVYMLMPFASPVYEAAMQVTEDPSLDVYVLLGDSMMGVVLGYMAVFLVVFGVLALPVYYRYRMVNYIIMDQPGVGGMQAMFQSRAMTRRRMELFKVDLSFWWFYVLEALLTVLCYGDMILEALGVALPVSDGVAYWGFQLLAMAGQLGLYCWAKPKLEVTYACCYEELSQSPEPAPQPKAPKTNPWTY